MASDYLGYSENQGLPSTVFPSINTGDDGDDWRGIFQSVDVMSAVIFSLVFVLGVLGNGVVIWATGFRTKKTVNSVWYLNLAVANFLVAAYLPLDVTKRALVTDDVWPFSGKFTCKMDAMVFYLNMYASIFTLALIGVDRCVVCVASPVWTGNHRTVRKASWVSVGVWVLALALSAPHFILKDTVIVEGVALCNDNYALVADFTSATKHKEMELHYLRRGATVVTRVVVGFVVPFSVVVSCCSVIVHRLRKDRSLAGRSGRSFKAVATVIAAFFLCWLPYHIIWLIMFMSMRPGVFAFSDTLRLMIASGRPISHALALVNSCLNPLLYAFAGPGFKDVFRIRKVLEKAFTESGRGGNVGSTGELISVVGSRGQRWLHQRAHIRSRVAGATLAPPESSYP